jgi:hypothetical protein
MSTRSTRTYSDISDILARKAEGRRELAARSLGEKIEMLETLRARVEPIRRAREARSGDQKPEAKSDELLPPKRSL